VLVTRLLERLQALVPGWLAQVDLIAGTSTGGIIALGLAAGISPRRLTELYELEGATIFADTLWDNIKDIGNLRGAQFSNEPLKNAIYELIGDLRLRDLHQHVLIPSFDLDSGAGDFRHWKAKFFHNFPGKDSDGDELVMDVALRTSAAPTIFPVYQGYIDGGAVANNPSVCALTQALHPETGGQQIGDIALLSLGTGVMPRYLTTENGDWGLLQWAPHLVDLILEGGEGLSDYQCRQILQKRYFRFNPKFTYPIDVDDIAQIPNLIAIADNIDLTSATAWLQTYFL
jgi:patatin-like phospholipase/acyl hydrolase